MFKFYLENYYGYYILFLFLLTFSILTLFFPYKENKFYKIFCILSSFFIIFRFDVEFDYVWYWIVGDNRFKEYYFYNYAYNRIDLFFKILYSITRVLNNPKVFFIITGIIFSIIFFKELRKYTKNKFIALSFYFYLNTVYLTFLIGFIRQGLAIIFSFYLFEKLNKKNYVLYIFFTILNSLFIHKSAVICIIFIFLKIFDKNQKIINLFYLIIIFLAFSVKKVINNFPFLHEYRGYLKRGIIQNDLGKKILIILFIIFLIILLVNLFFKIKPNEEEKFLINIIFTGFVLYFIFLKLIGGHIPLRIGSYFLFYYPIFISAYINKLRYKKVISLFFIITLFSFGNYKLIKESIREIETERVSRQFKLMFFLDYDDLNGKYIPKRGKVEYQIKN